MTRRLGDIPTPALVVDVKAMERNIARMAAFFAAGTSRLRPHFKAHKTSAIARRQLAAGSAVGLACATVSEAEVVAPYCADILITSEIVTAGACTRAAALARDRTVTVAVDSLVGLEAIGAAAARVGVTVGVLIDLDVGQHRCGLEPGMEALALATRAASMPGVRLNGVMGYEGHVQAVRERAVRASRAQQAMTQLVDTADLLQRHGLPCEVVSAGGTGTYDMSGRTPGVTEIQAGSYVLMDADYGQLDLPFEAALFVMGTVTSRPVPTRAVADCGHKSCTKDHGLPIVVDVDGARVLGLYDEHATIELPASASLAIGDRVRLQPSHIDPTINLHDALYVVDGEIVVDVWPVDGRGYADERASVHRDSNVERVRHLDDDLGSRTAGDRITG